MCLAKLSKIEKNNYLVKQLYGVKNKVTIYIIRFYYFEFSYYFLHIDYVFELCVWLHNYSLIEIKIKITKQTKPNF